MNNELIFDRPGIYEPRICGRVVLWRRNDDNPLVGAQVNSAAHANRFANVHVIQNNESVAYLPVQEAGE